MENQRAYSLIVIKAIDEEKREITGLATTPSADRAGDIVEPKGADFKLPIPLLWQHQSGQPIGEVYAAKVTAAGIEIKARIAKIDEPGKLKERLDEAWQSVKIGLVKGLSIGFQPLEYSRIGETYAYRYLKWLWLELSAVTIPANADCSILSIKSIDTSTRAALGLTRKGLNNPGATGLNISRSTGKNMTIKEQIASFEAKRAAAADRMASIMNKSSDEGRTLDDAEAEEYDGHSADVAGIDKHLKRLREQEVTMIAKATPILPNAGIDAPRHSRVVVVERNLPKGTAFTRYCIALAVAKGNIMQAAEIAKRWDGETPEVSNVLKAAIGVGSTDFAKMAGPGGMESVLKAAVSAGTTTDTTWAAPLVQYQDMASEFIELLRPMTILGKLPLLRKVPFNIRIPRQTAGTSGSFVGEGAPKPVNAMAFDNITMTWAKAAVIVVLSDELVRFSNPSAEALARQDLLNGISTYLDKRFIDPTYEGVSGVSPASITNGITPVDSTGSTLAAITNDVTDVMESFVTANLNLTSGAWVMSPGIALKLSMLRNVNDEFVFPRINMNGGEWFGLPVVTSNSATNAGSPSEGFIALLDQQEILLADDGSIAIDMSMEASLQMNDAPSAGAQSLVSLWQNNLIGLRAERYINWARRRSQAVALIGNVNY